MQPSRHWLIGSALGCLVAATLAVLTDAALPPAAPLPAPLPLPPAAPGAVSPFSGVVPALPADTPPPPSPSAATPEPPAAPTSRSLAAELGPGADELQALIDDLANRPSVDAALDRDMRDMLLADVRQRLQNLRHQHGAPTEVAQLERMLARLQQLP